MFGRHPVPKISVADAAEQARAGRLVLVDVREPGEIAQAAVPGARHIALGGLAARLGELPAGQTIGFICRSGNRSGTATRSALRAGLDAVNVEGGVLAWSRAGLPLTRDGKGGA
jgi:rhodanese-related sulfurtransferase